MVTGVTHLEAILPDGSVAGTPILRMQLSGDGRHLAFMMFSSGTASFQLYVRNIGTAQTVAVPDSGGGQYFSIDDNGGKVAFDTACRTTLPMKTGGP
jgi:hypothetical protein